MYPYVEDALLQGYAGFLCYLLWIDKQKEGAWKSDADACRYHANALHYFGKSVALLPMDMFVYYYAEVRFVCTRN